MSKMKRLKDVTVGIILGGVLFSGASYAASATNISVNFLPLKYFFDGVEKKASSDQKGFIYNGTTYVPLRFVAESLGKEVGYDAPTTSIYVGTQKEGTITYLEEMKTLSTSSAAQQISTFETNTGEKFVHGLSTGTWAQPADHPILNEYSLNGQYKRFEAFIAPEKYYKNRSIEESIGSVKIYADEKLVYTSGAIASNLAKPIKIDLDLTGVVKFKIEAQGYQIGILDAKFIQ